jgi:hypothetical protein
MPALPAALRRGPLLVRRVPLVLALVVVALIAAAVLAVVVIAGGNDSTKLLDPAPENHAFHIDGEADRYAGPAPMKIKFYADAYHNKGGVTYFWRFDDGFATKDKNPTHTFVKPGYYQVLVDAVDSKTKNNDRFNLFIGVWPADVWAKAQSGKAVNNQAEVAQQWARTRQRKRDLIANCLRDPACQKRQLKIDQTRLANLQKELKACTKKKCEKVLAPAIKKIERTVENDKRGIPHLP